VGAKLEDYWNFSACPAPLEMIDELFIIHRESPIDIFGFTIDCDEDSLATMLETLTYFDDQPLEPDVFEMVDGVKCVLWRKTDNTKQSLAKDQLAAFYHEAKKQKALRASKLYAKKRKLKDGRGTYAEALDCWLST
jgi:tyrosyl-tRNA synthetase